MMLEEEVSLGREDERSLPPTKHQARSSPSYSGWSSSGHKCERNLEDEEEAATATEEDELLKLE
jgi:hypothetical protein